MLGCAIQLYAGVSISTGRIVHPNPLDVYECVPPPVLPSCEFPTAPADSPCVLRLAACCGMLNIDGASFCPA